MSWWRRPRTPTAQPPPAPHADAAGHQFGPPGRLHRGRRLQGRRRGRARARRGHPGGAGPRRAHAVAGRPPPRRPTPPRLAAMLSDADLLRTPLAELTALARVVRDGAHGRRVTFSPKVFIPLTMLCRDRCGYCTFAKAPARLPRRTSPPRRCSRSPGPAGTPGATRRCSRWASAPSCATRWRATGSPRTATRRRWTTSRPCADSSWRRPACSPTPTPARSSPTSWRALRPVSASQGMMLESLAEGLGGAPRRARQGAGAPAGHPGGGRRARHPVHHGDPRRHRRRPGRPAGGAARHRGVARPPRPRARGHRPELPAQAGDGHGPGRALPARGPVVGHRGGPPGAARPRSTSRRRRTSPTTWRRCSTPASTTGAACRRSRPTT